MICTLTARRLKPGTYEQFRAIWDAEQEAHPDVAGKWNPIYVTRDVNDANVLLAFGFFNGTLQELRQAQQEYGYSDVVNQIAPLVEEILLDGAYEVIEEQRA